MQANYVIVGLGLTGVSCVKYLLSQNQGIAVVDSRENPPGLKEFKKNFPHVPLYLGSFDHPIIFQAKELVISPGIPLTHPVFLAAQQQGIGLIGDIELFARACRSPIIGITGTNAKGTVTTLVGEMAKASGKKVLVGGNIGVPALDLLAQEPAELYVLELSSFQLERTQSLKTLASCILNLTPDHLDHHGTVENYLAAKQVIYQSTDFAVWNRDDKATYPNVSPQKKLLSFGLDVIDDQNYGLSHADNTTWLMRGKEKLLDVKQLKINGQHNYLNALAAMALGEACGFELKDMLTALSSFKGLLHRCEWVREKNKVIWYNDSKGTNVGATLAAINGLGSTIKGKLVLIAGGLGKGADFSLLREPVKRFVKNVILIGKDAPVLAETFKDLVPLQHAKTLQEAVLLADSTAVENDAVLLSPACASWDMFQHYEERGEVFKQAVRNL